MVRRKRSTIPFDEAYGPVNPEMILEMPKDRFPKDMELENGMPLMMSDQQGQQFQVKIVEIKEEAVMLDANHPLAGKDLTFDLELVEIVHRLRRSLCRKIFMKCKTRSIIN